MSTETTPAPTGQLAVRPRASHQLAALMGMEPNAMLDVIKAQCFRGNSANITDAQLAAFVSIAADMGVNPLLPGMLYAFPVQGGGIIPMMGPDGVYKKLTEHPDVDGWETIVFPEDVAQAPTHATTKIWRKNRERPMQYTALLSEWKVGSNPNWNTRTRHMLGLRSLKQAARQIIHGVPYDEDERVIMGEVNVTPPDAASTEPEPTVTRATPPKREKKGAATVAENPKKESGKVVEADFTEAPKDEQPPKPATDEQPPKLKEESAPKPNDTAPANVQRAFLKPNEEIEAVCTVASVIPTMLDLDRVNAPSIQASVSGEFHGEVIHHKCATGDATKVIAPDIWTVGNTLKLKLFGRQFKGGVRTMVLAAEKVTKGMVLE